MKIPFSLRLFTNFMDNIVGKIEAHDVAVVKARNKQFVKWSSFLTPKTKLPKVVDSTITGRHGTIPIRIYYPNLQPNLPIVLYFHGGGWVLYDLDSHDPVCRYLAKDTQAIVISVDYRLAPEYRYPTAVEDCYDALLWVAQNGQNIGGNPEKIAVAGDSAGGNLATVMCLKARDEQGPKISFQALIYPGVDATMSSPSCDRNGEGYFLTKKAMRWYLDQYIGEYPNLKDPYLSPLFAPDLSGLPPALVLTAEFDPLVDEGKRYADRLAAAGVPVRYIDYKGMIHAFYSLHVLTSKARQANKVVANSIKLAFQ